MRGIISIEKIRPDGLEYPIGLSNTTGGPIFNAATNSTGGNQTMDIDNTFVVHTFTSSGFFEPGFSPRSLFSSFIVVKNNPGNYPQK